MEMFKEYLKELSNINITPQDLILTYQAIELSLKSGASTMYCSDINNMQIYFGELVTNKLSDIKKMNIEGLNYEIQKAKHYLAFSETFSKLEDLCQEQLIFIIKSYYVYKEDAISYSKLQSENIIKELKQTKLN